MLAAIIPIIAGAVGQVAKNIFPDPADELKRQQLENEVKLAVMDRAADIQNAAADIVRTEAASSHWLAANWRPLMMVFFAVLIGARWFGFTAPGISEAEYIQLWSIIELGLGGYVIGRTVEKIAPGVIDAVRSRK